MLSPSRFENSRPDGIGVLEPSARAARASLAGSSR